MRLGSQSPSLRFFWLAVGSVGCWKGGVVPTVSEAFIQKWNPGTPGVYTAATVAQLTRVYDIAPHLYGPCNASERKRPCLSKLFTACPGAALTVKVIFE